MAWLGVADYTVFALVIGIALAVGLYEALAGGGQKNTSAYMVGDRRLKLVPALASMFMSSISAISVLGTPVEMYLYGTQAWTSCLSMACAYVMSAYVFVPMMYNLRITSVFKFHQLRFSSNILRHVAVYLSIVTTSIYMGLSLYSPAVALHTVTGLSLHALIITTAIVTIIYSSMGGIRAVVMNDFIQGFIFMAGLLIFLFVGVWKVGGIYDVFQLANQKGRLIFFNMNPDPRMRQSFWISLVVPIIIGFSTAISNQSNVQRYCSIPTLRQAKIAMYMQGLLEIVVSTIIALIGLVIFAYYEKIGCDPYRSGAISSPNQIVPYFVVDVLNYPGFPGLFLAILYAGALSSASSSMAGLCAITWKEILEKFTSCQNMTDLNKVMLAKLIVVLWGSVGTAVALLVPLLSGHIVQVTATLMSCTFSPLTGIMLLGALVPFVNWKSACIGALCGFIITTVISMGQYTYWPFMAILPTTVDNCTMAANVTVRPILPDRTDVSGLFRISYSYIGVVGLLTTIGVAIFLSLILEFGRQKEVFDPRTVIDYSQTLWCCLKNNKYNGNRAEDEKRLKCKDTEINLILPTTGEPLKQKTDECCC